MWFLVAEVYSPSSGSEFSFDETTSRLGGPGDETLSGAGSDHSTDIDTVYNKAEQFIKLCNDLQSAPSLLETTCAELNEHGKQLTESIDALKSQAQRVTAISLSDK